MDGLIANTTALSNSSLNPDAIKASLVDGYGHLDERLAELKDGFDRFMTSHEKIEDDDIAGRAGDFVKQLKALSKSANAARENEKRPIDACAAVVQSFFKGGLMDAAERMERAVQGKITAYLLAKEQAERRRRDEEARIARVEADKRAREAEAAAEAERQRLASAQQADEAMDVAIVAARVADQQERAAIAKPADLSRTRGDFGSVSSLRGTVKFRLTDITLVPADFVQLNDAMVKARGKGWKEGDAQPIPGVEFYIERSAAVR